MKFKKNILRTQRLFFLILFGNHGDQGREARYTKQIWSQKIQIDCQVENVTDRYLTENNMESENKISPSSILLTYGLRRERKLEFYLKPKAVIDTLLFDIFINDPEISCFLH